jgi:hypothetical protein
MVWLRLVFVLPLLLSPGCSRPPADSTPDGVVHLWLEKMEASAEDPRAAREAYALLGPAAKHNLEQRAERAGRMQGRRFEPYEMLAEGRFGLKFRPKTMTVQAVSANEANVDIIGGDTSEHASVRCARDPQHAGVWRIEPELPPVPELLRVRDGG